jgi:hypothetical protein
MGQEDFDYIRRAYKINAKCGQRVAFTYQGRKEGTILNAEQGRLRILLDGEKRVGYYHPTWKLEYLTEGGAK